MPMNRHAVGAQGASVVVLLGPRVPLTPLEAFEFAANLVVMAESVHAVYADKAGFSPLPEFNQLCDQIRNT